MHVASWSKVEKLGYNVEHQLLLRTNGAKFTDAIWIIIGVYNLTRQANNMLFGQMNVRGWGLIKYHLAESWG
jgi:hypothetical protein